MNVNLPMVLAHLLLLAIVLQQVPIALSAEPVQKAPAEVEAALSRAGKNRPALEKALKNAPAEQHQGMEFLIANMPDADLQSLSADFLLENVALAYRAKKQFAWGAKFSDEIFFNNVLPYANVDEVRDPWRKELYDLCMPLVKDCKTSSEAVHILNSKLFEKLKVRYSTQRRKPQQSPKESIETGMASCTGLSILLSDACRSVAIPTRVVGTPLWANKRGNHTWLEIWDGRSALHGALRTRSERTRSRLVCGRRRTGQERHAGTCHLCGEFPEDQNRLSAGLGSGPKRGLRRKYHRTVRAHRTAQ